MRVGVTGGTGDLGRAVVARLLDADHEVRASHLTSATPPALVRAEWVRMDLTDAAAVRAFVEGCDAVVHTAYRADAASLQPVVVAGSAALARAAAGVGARLVHVSTDVVFAGRDRVPYREDDDPDPVTPYGIAKAEAERLVMTIDPVAVMLRPSLLWSSAHDDHQSEMVRSALSGERPVVFYSDEYRCPVRTEDVAAVVEACLGSEVRGPLHVAGRDRVSRDELAGLLAGAMGWNPLAVVGGKQPEGGPPRPRDIALDSTRAEVELGVPLHGIRELLGG